MVGKISVVIPNYNGIDLLKKNLPIIISSTRDYAPDAEIIVADDASTDESVAFLRGLAGVKIIKLTKHRGFSSTINSGIKMSKGDFVVLLNNDVIPEKGYLENSIKHFKDKNVFAVSFHEKGYGWARGYFKDGYVNHEGVLGEDKVHESFWVNGGSGIFRKEQLRDLGYFDDKLFSPFYWEDIDLSYRAAKRGLKVLWDPDSNVIHNHESTTGKISKRTRNYIVERNQLLFIWKNITSPILFRKHLIGLFGRLARQPMYLRIVIAALLKIGIVKSKRQIEKKEAKVSDEAIFLRFSK
jgi:GT2 family glycosyltransferase